MAKRTADRAAAGGSGGPTPGRPYKLLILLALFVAGFAAVAARLFTVQIVDGADYRERARKQYEARLPLAADRGSIYDRNDNEIATTVLKLSIAVDPKVVQHPERICRVLDSLTAKSAESYLAKIRQASGSFVWLERALDGVEYSSLADMDDPGLIRRWESSRHFAYGTLASQVVGFTNVDNKGLSGIELHWDSLLHGTPGYAIVQRDGRGNKRRKPDLPTIPPRKGSSIILTLDMNVQGIVESELRAGVLNAEAESGTAIGIIPATGEILAMASYPTFNPNDISTASDELARNRSITDMYEPGSTFKVVSAAALLEEELLSEVDTVDGHSGALEMHEHVIRDEVALGRVSFTDAVVHSSNIVFAEQVRNITADRFYKYVRDFGFGIYLGLDLPGEVRGRVLKPREFDPSTKSFMAYGYGLAATALQIVNAYATVANEGVMMKPYIVSALRNEEGDNSLEVEPQTIRRVIRPEVARALTRLLCQVVERGSGKEARVAGLAIAGKTGTAQQLRDGAYSKRDYTASFAGFFPADQPELALIVMLNKPRRGYYGGKVAAPIFRQIARRLVSAGLIEAPPPDEALADAPAGDSASGVPLVRVPDIRGLAAADARALLHRSGLRIVTDFRDGIVQEQQPLPGAELEKGREVQALLRSSLVTARADSSPALLRLHDRRPDVRGMTLRRALNILHAARVKVRVQGSGVVRKQRWQEGAEALCLLECRR